MSKYMYIDLCMCIYDYDVCMICLGDAPSMPSSVVVGV